VHGPRRRKKKLKDRKIGSGEARAASCRGLRLGSWEAGRRAKRARLEARKLWRFKAFNLST